MLNIHISNYHPHNYLIYSIPSLSGPEKYVPKYTPLIWDYESEVGFRYVERLCWRAKIAFKFSLSQKIIIIFLSYASDWRTSRSASANIEIFGQGFIHGQNFLVKFSNLTKIYWVYYTLTLSPIKLNYTSLIRKVKLWYFPPHRFSHLNCTTV